MSSECTANGLTSNSSTVRNKDEEIAFGGGEAPAEISGIDVR